METGPPASARDLGALEGALRAGRGFTHGRDPAAPKRRHASESPGNCPSRGCRSRSRVSRAPGLGWCLGSAFLARHLEVTLTLGAPLQGTLLRKLLAHSRCSASICGSNMRASRTVSLACRCSQDTLTALQPPNLAGVRSGPPWIPVEPPGTPQLRLPKHGFLGVDGPSPLLGVSKSSALSVLPSQTALPLPVWFSCSAQKSSFKIPPGPLMALSEQVPNLCAAGSHHRRRAERSFSSPPKPLPGPLASACEVAVL